MVEKRVNSEVQTVIERLANKGIVATGVKHNVHFMVYAPLKWAKGFAIWVSVQKGQNCVQKVSESESELYSLCMPINYLAVFDLS